MSRSSHPEVFCKKSVIKNFGKFQENTCARFYFLIKLQTASVCFFQKNMK